MDAIAAIGGQYSIFSNMALVVTPMLISAWVLHQTADRIKEENTDYQEETHKTIVQKIKQRLSFLSIFQLHDKVNTDHEANDKFRESVKLKFEQ